MRPRALALLLSLASSALFDATAGAQQTLGVALNPSATIALDPITGGGVRNLDFGTLPAGGSADTGPGQEALPANGTTTAKWEFGGLKKNRTVTLTFSLPSAVTRGAVSLPIAWNNPGYGRWCTRVNTTPVTGCGGPGTTQATFNPAGAPVSLVVQPGTSNNNRFVTVWAGAKLGNPTIPANAPPGLYTATVTLTIAY